MLRTVRPREWRAVFIYALIVMALTTVPYLLGFAAQRDGWQFTGFVFGVEDGNSYLAKMRQGATDGWLFHIVYTAEAHDGAFLFTPYLALGKLAGLLADPRDPGFVSAMLFVFHAARILFGILAILVTYRFAALFLPRGGMRWLALILITLGGGLGWLLTLLGHDTLLGSVPVDFYLPEGYTFYLLYGLPHLSLARAALLGGFMFLFEPSGAQGSALFIRRIPRFLAAGVCWLVMGLCVPFYVAVLAALLGVWGLAELIRLRRFPFRLFLKAVLAALIPAPLLIYSLLVFAINPVLAVWGEQNRLPSPHPLHYVLGFGVPALLAIPAARWAWRRGRFQPAYLLLPAWAISAPLLAYLPVSVQRRLLEGMFVPLCILAVVGLRYGIVPALRTRRRPVRLIWRRSAVLSAALMLPTTGLLLLAGVFGALRTAPPLFHASAEIAALDWLNVNAAPGAVVASDVAVGNYLPARTDLRAFVGHGPETVNYTAKRALVEGFLRGEQSFDALKAVPGDPIRYLFTTPAQRTVSALDRLPFPVIFDRDDYRIVEIP